MATKPKRREEDDEDEDRPRKKKKKPRSKLPLFIGLGVGAGVLLVLIIVLVVVIAINAGGDNQPKKPKQDLFADLKPPPPPPPPPAKQNFDKVQIGEKVRPGSGVRVKADWAERVNELKQIGIFYNQYRAEFGKAPPTVDDFTNYIKREAPQIKKAIDEKYYVLLPKVTANTGIIAYELDPDTNQLHGYVDMSGAADAITTKELVARIKAQGN
jgi:hypothetical protein